MLQYRAIVVYDKSLIPAGFRDIIDYVNKSVDFYEPL